MSPKGDDIPRTERLLRCPQGKDEKMKEHETKYYQNFYTDQLRMASDKDREARAEALLMSIALSLAAIADILENRL